MKKFHLKDLFILLVAVVSVAMPVALFDAQADAEQSEPAQSGDSLYVISLPQVHVDDMHLYDTVDVMLNSGNSELGGFELKFGAPGRFFDIIEVLPGELCDSCQWEMFNAKRLDSQKKPQFPSIMWQVVALAKFLPDSTKPVCFTLNRPTSLARLVVSNEFAHQYRDTVLPIYFIWDDCTDNSVSGVDGNTLYLSSRVVDYFPNNFDTTGTPFPTVRGAPRNCIKPGGPNIPKRAIEFRNGGVEFKLNLTPEDTTVQGADTE